MTRGDILAGQRRYPHAERAAMRRERLVEFFGPGPIRRKRQLGGSVPLEVGSQGPRPGRLWQLACARAQGLLANGAISEAEACTTAIREHVRTNFERPSDLPELVLRMLRTLARMPAPEARSRRARGRARMALPPDPWHLPDIVVDSVPVDRDIRTDIQYVLERHTSTGKR